MEILDSVVIGAGQAGLSTSYHLRRRGIDHVVLDADDAPGGAWQHRWDSLTMHDVHGIAALPGLRRRPAEPDGRANEVVPAYFADYERDHHLPVLRPVRVDQVTEADDGLLGVRAGDRTLDRPARSSTRPGPGRGRSCRTTRARRPSAASSCTPTTTPARSTSAEGAWSSWAAARPRCSCSARSPPSPPTRSG